MAKKPDITPPAEGEKLLVFEGKIIDKSFVGMSLTDINAKGATFERCDFSHCIFTRAYFRDSEFTKCYFIGARFYDCNFRHARLSFCDFKYALFQNTLIPVSEVIANLPEWPNVKGELLRSHRVNAHSIGDTEAEKKYIIEEMAALREYYQKARQKRESYYIEKYSGVKNWFKTRWESFKLWLGWVVWEYGENPVRLLISLIVTLIVLSLVAGVQLLTLDASLTLSEIGSALWKGLRTTLSLFLGLQQMLGSSVNWLLASIIVLIRYVAFGLFVAIIFRRFSKR